MRIARVKRAGQTFLISDRAPGMDWSAGSFPQRHGLFDNLLYVDGHVKLQAHIQLMTGVVIPIVENATDKAQLRILVGESDETRALGLTSKDFKSQEYLVELREGVIVLIGRDKADTGKVEYAVFPSAGMEHSWPGVWDDRGTLDAAYEFLQIFCGVKWLNPTELGTVAPETKTLEVAGTSIRRQPVMRFRGGHAAFPPDQYQYGGGLWLSGTPEAAAYHSAAFPGVYGTNSLESHEKEAYARRVIRARNVLFMLRMRAGGDNMECNHSFYDYYARFWKKDDNRPGIFVESRPEYFAKGHDDKQPPQMCYSSPLFISQVIQDIREYFDNGGTRWGVNNYAIEPMDNSFFCKCAECSKQFELSRPWQDRHSTYWFGFVKKVAEAIQKSHPTKTISTLAYMTHEGLPTDLKLPANVAVHFCFSSNRMPYDEAAQAEQIKRIKQWRDYCLNDFYLWLYHTFPREIAMNGRFYCFPGNFAHELKKQLDVFQKMDVKGIFHCGFNGEVENYISYKLMDDPSCDIDILLNEYFSQYGPAANAIKSFYEMIEERYCNPDNYPATPSGLPFNGHQTPAVAWEYLGTKDFMDKIGSYIAEAEDKATTSPYKERVALWKMATWDYMKAGYDHYDQRKRASIPNLRVPRVPEAHGNVNNVAWDKAVSLGKDWYDRGGMITSKRQFEGRVCHDGKFLYLELTDHVDPSKLEVSAEVFCFDVWEIMVARQRAQPFRQYATGPTGLTKAMSYGEINWRQGVPMEQTGYESFRVDRSDKWVMRMKWPLSTVVEQPVTSGEALYMNILRVSNNNISGSSPYGIDTWVSCSTVREVDRLGSLYLEP